MILSVRRPETGVAFLDSATGEVMLKATSDANSLMSWEYRLYDSNGKLAAAAEPAPYPNGLSVRSENGELLLSIPADIGAYVLYRLYNHSGALITSSDGNHTQIFPFLRMESIAAPKAVRVKSPQKD